MADVIIQFNYGRQKAGDLVSDKKIGRPTNNPKTERITVRLDSESTDILNKYCKQENIAERAEAIRRGIKKLKDDLREK